MNDDVTRIVTAKGGEELVDIKLLLQAGITATEAGVANEVADAFDARRNGRLRTLNNSPERVKSVTISSFIPELG